MASMPLLRELKEGKADDGMSFIWHTVAYWDEETDDTLLFKIFCGEFVCAEFFFFLSFPQLCFDGKRGRGRGRREEERN